MIKFSYWYWVPEQYIIVFRFGSLVKLKITTNKLDVEVDKKPKP